MFKVAWVFLLVDERDGCCKGVLIPADGIGAHLDDFWIDDRDVKLVALFEIGECFNDAFAEDVVAMFLNGAWSVDDEGEILTDGREI